MVFVVVGEDRMIFVPVCFPPLGFEISHEAVFVIGQYCPKTFARRHALFEAGVAAAETITNAHPAHLVAIVDVVDCVGDRDLNQKVVASVAMPSHVDALDVEVANELVCVKQNVFQRVFVDA